MTSVALAVMGYSAGLDYMLESARICRDYVDEIVFIGDDFTEEDYDDFQEASNDKGEYYKEEWTDDFSAYKNKLLSHIHTDYVLVMDHDEIPTPELAANLKILISKAKSQDANLVYLKAINITHERDGKQTMHLSDGKPNLHEVVSEPYFGDCHIWLRPHYYSWHSFKSQFAYYHIKTWQEQYERAIRNVYLAGGGDSWKDKNPFGHDHWVKLRAICTKDGVKNYKDLLIRIREGTISQELKDWMKWVRELKWHDDELRAWSEYWNILHENDKL